jgi:hypothetical protein
MSRKILVFLESNMISRPYGNHERVVLKLLLTTTCERVGMFIFLFLEEALIEK